MAQLTKGLYGSEFRSTSTLFGLRCGQMSGSSEKMGHNAGWYNKLGEKLGWGDISIGDFQRICREIEGDELFITLSERDSFWELVVDLGASASTAVMSPSAEAPGVEYVAEKCHYIIGRDEIYHIDNNDSGDRVIIKGLSFKVLSREAAKILITSATS